MVGAIVKGVSKVGKGAVKGVSKAKGAARQVGAVMPSTPAAQNVGMALPPVAKTALGVAAAAAIIYIGYKLIKAPAALMANKGNVDERTDVKKELDRIAKQATLSNSQAAVIANAIFAAMDGYGTDEQGIVNQMKKVKNNADFLKVQSKYGTREVSSGRFNPEPNYKGNLTGAMGSELSTYWTSLVNKNLKSKGVTYKV